MEVEIRMQKYEYRLESRAYALLHCNYINVQMNYRCKTSILP